MKEISLLTRSGFNKQIDDHTRNNVIDKPITEKQLMNKTLRKTTTRKLVSMIRDTSNRSDSVPSDLDMSPNSIREQNQTMNSTFRGSIKHLAHAEF
jgi:hypothetical protein